jgi:PAS domain S-box-containing protein
MTAQTPSTPDSEKTKAQLLDEISVLKAQNEELRKSISAARQNGGESDISIATLSEAVERIQDGFALYDADDRLVFCNESYRTGDALDLTAILKPGVSFEEVLRARVSAGIIRAAKDDPEKWIRDRLEQHRRGGTRMIQSNDAGSSRRAFQLTEYKTRSGGTVLVRTNVAERLRVEEALRASESIFRSIFENTDVGMTVVSQDRTIRLFNPAICRILGYTPEEFGATMLRDLSHPEDRDKNIRHLVADGLSGREYDKRFRRKDGQYATCHVSTSAVTDDHGRIQYAVSIFRDVTESQRIEQQLRQSQKMEAIGQLTGGLAHDFNNLMSVIMINGQLVADRVVNDPILSERINAVLGATLRGAELTKHLLAFSRQQLLEPEVVDADAVISETGSLLRRTIGEAIRINIVTSQGLWPMRIDRAQFESALLNLALNARDAMPGGGLLTIETANVVIRAADPAAASGLVPGEYVMVVVSDSGTGMSPTVLQSAFEPFFTTKEVGAGTGLGLSMIYGFVAQSKGHIELSSKEGRGTTVRMYFPRTEAPGSRAKPRDENRQGLPGGKERILVVEDQPDVRGSLCALLGGLGYQVSEVENSDLALDLLREKAPEIDLILSDVIMPGHLDGSGLAEIVRERYPAIKVLLMTGYTHPSASLQGRLGKGVKVIAKPFANKDLAKTIRDVLAR